jgi:hypothetical protein
VAFEPLDLIPACMRRKDLFVGERHD